MTEHEVPHEIVEEQQHLGAQNRKIALLISVLALFLALGETLSKSAQTEALSFNVQSSDAWAFYQAKTIRLTTLRTAAENLELEFASASEAAKPAIQKRIEDWRKEVSRLDSEPKTGEGRKELMERAKQLEEERDTAMARYHHFEVAAAAIQIGIVLASASVVTSMVVLAWLSGGLGIVGLAFVAIGLFVPHAVHLF